VLKLVQGHAPSGREVALDVSFLSRRHLRLGQRIGVVALNSLEQFTIVGALKFGNVGSIGGASIVQTDLATAQRITGKRGRLDEIRVAAASGVTPVDLVH
jgi:putative ABC transport system permease protein